MDVLRQQLDEKEIINMYDSWSVMTGALAQVTRLFKVTGHDKTHMYKN